MKKITFAMLIITFIMYIGLNFFPNESTADINSNEYSARDSYLNIMVCNKSQYYMVKKISGERHNVQYLINDESDIKSFKYDKNIINNASNMDLFMYSGNSYEPWDNDFIEQIDKSKVGIVNISRGIRMLNYSNESGKVNPYYWNGLEEYKIALYNIKNAIQDRDPKNREVYDTNYNNAIEYLDKNISIYNTNKQKLNHYTFILADEKLAYFMKNLDIDYYLLKPSDNLDEYIKQKDIDKSKLIIVKDAENQMNFNDYNVVTLESYSSYDDFEDIIFNNYKKIFSVIKDYQINEQ